MTPWEDAREILELVKDEGNWNQQLFDRCSNNTLVNPCIFNMIRAKLPERQYTKFDDLYCLNRRPGDKELISNIRRERSREQWKKDRQEKIRKIQALERKLNGKSQS